MSEKCQCCKAKALFELSGYGYACGRHLAYVVKMCGTLGADVNVTLVPHDH